MLVSSEVNMAINRFISYRLRTTRLKLIKSYEIETVAERTAVPSRDDQKLIVGLQ